MIDKKVTLIIGNDVQMMNLDLFGDFKSHEYQECFIDQFGSRQAMDYWQGDEFFSNYMEIFYFFGINYDEDSSKCKGLKIWFNEYVRFNDKDKEFWKQIVEDSGYPTQIKINTSFGEVKDFEYNELKDF